MKEAIIVPFVPKKARYAKSFKLPGFFAIIYRKRIKPEHPKLRTYVRLCFPESEPRFDVVLKIKGTKRLEEALALALREVKLEEVISERWTA